MLAASQVEPAEESDLEGKQTCKYRVFYSQKSVYMICNLPILQKSTLSLPEGI